MKVNQVTGRGVKMNEKPSVILLVEDNRDHAELIREIFGDHQGANRIYHVSDGEAALDYVFRRGDYREPEKSPRPHLILLDLRLPTIDALEVLKQIKATEELRRIPVVVLTTSEAETDVAGAYDNHTNGYLVKPADFERFTQMINEIGSYWLTWNHTVSD